MGKHRIGAQLIIWGKRKAEDPLSVLDEVSSLNYEGIETDKSLFEDMQNPREVLSSRNLKLAGLHTGFNINEETVDSILNLMLELDGHYLIFSGAGGEGNTEEEYRRNAKVLEEIGRRAVDFDVKVCYHNHWQEIINDALGIKIICEETDPEYVSLCVDTYWVWFGGLSPKEFMEENLDRIVYIHLKDGTKSKDGRYVFCELGSGALNFHEVMDVLMPTEIEWFIVEQDRTERTPLESMRISRKYLQENFNL